MVPVGVTTVSTFTAGVDYVDKTINIVADDLIETIEKFTVALTTPIGGAIFEPITTTVYILDETGMIQEYMFLPLIFIVLINLSRYLNKD